MIRHSTIARRYIRNKGSNFSTFLSYTTMLGIALGVASLILTISVMNGFEKQLIDRTLMASPHISVYSYAPPDYDSITSSEVTQKYTFKSNSGVIKVGSKVKGAKILGLSDFSNFKSKPIAGSPEDILNKPRRIALGVGLANALNATIGSKLDVIYEDEGNKPKTRVYKVGYIYEVGFASFDNAVAIISLSEAEHNWKDSQYIMGLRVKDPMSVDIVANEIRAKYGCLDCVESWREKNRNILEAMRMERTVMAIILSIVVLISLFNLVSSLVMTVKDKTSSIAILKSMGATRFDIRKIFMLQGFIMGVIGATVGLLAGLIVATNIASIVAFFESLMGSRILDPSIYYITEIKSEIIFSQVLIFYISAIVLSIITTIIPSRIASNIEIVKGLENA